MISQNIPFPTLFGAKKDLIKEEIKKSDKKPAIKQALTLFFINGYRGKEIALLTGMSETTIHAHTSRFKTHLLEKYEMLR